MRYVLLLLGVFCASTSVIFIRATETDPLFLSAYRLIVASVVLAPIYFHCVKRNPEWTHGRLFRLAAAPAVILALHFLSWLAGARMTPAANSSLIVNMVPVVMPFLLYFMIRETVTGREIMGTVLAFAGVLVLGVADFNYSPEYALGDAVCFGSMLLYALYLVFGRRNREIPRIYLYVVPVYSMAGVVALAVAVAAWALGLTGPLIGPDTRIEVIGILGLGIVPTIFGHSLINWALKHLRGQVVGILNLGQFIFAGAMGYLILNEVPANAYYFASILVVCGALVVIRSMPRRARALPAKAEGQT